MLYEKIAVKIFSLILCLSLAGTCLVPAYAVSTGEGDPLAPYVDYVNSILPDLTRLPDADFPADDLSISQPIELLNDNDDTNYAFFLFDGSNCVGELVVTRMNGTFAASFLPGGMPLVSAAYANRTPVCLVAVEQRLLLCTESTADVIVGEAFQTYASRDHSVEAIVNQAQKESLSLTAAEVGPALLSGLPNTSKVLPIDIVENSSVNGVGICWAAVSASIIMYLTNYRGLTAETVYNKVKSNGQSAAGYPIDVTCALDSYGIGHYVYTSWNLSFPAVVNHITAGYPIYAAITRVGGSHAVAICGYMCESDLSDYYLLMDPNVSARKVWLSIDRNSSNFTYATSYGYTYTRWEHSVCSSLVT